MPEGNEKQEMKPLRPACHDPDTEQETAQKKARPKRTDQRRNQKSAAGPHEGSAQLSIAEHENTAFRCNSMRRRAVYMRFDCKWRNAKRHGAGPHRFKLLTS